MTQEEQEALREQRIASEETAIRAGRDAKELLEHPRFGEVCKDLEKRYAADLLAADSDDKLRRAQAKALCLVEFLREFRGMMDSGTIATEARRNRESHEAALESRKPRK